MELMMRIYLQSRMPLLWNTMRCLTRTQNPNNIAKGKKKGSSIFKANELYCIIRLYRDIEKKNISANQDEAKKNNCHKQLGCIL